MPSGAMMKVARWTPHVLLAVHRLLDPGAVLLGDLVVGVGEQGEVEIELVGELGDRLDLVGGDADHTGVGGFVVGAAVADPASLGRAARRIGTGIEVENDGFAPQVGEADLLAALIWQFEVGGFVACLGIGVGG